MWTKKSVLVGASFCWNRHKLFNVYVFVRRRLCFELKYVYSLFSSEPRGRRLFLVVHQLSVLCSSTFKNLKRASFLPHRTFVQLPCVW